MKDAENKDYSRDLVLRVSPSRNAFVVEEHKPGGIISYREIDPLELYYAISGSYTSNDFLESVAFVGGQHTENEACQQIVFKSS